MKMYILIREDVPLGFAMLAAAHASLAAYLKFRDSEEVQHWPELNARDKPRGPARAHRPSSRSAWAPSRS